MIDNLKPLTQQQKRFIAIVLSFTLICGLFLWMLLGWLNNTGSGSNKFSAAPEDIKNTEKISSQYIRDAGNWGLKEESLNGANLQLLYGIINSNNASSSKFWVDRSGVYHQLKQKYIPSGAPLDYSTSVLSTWSDDTPKQDLETFKIINSVSSSVKSEGHYQMLNGVKIPILTATVQYTTQENKHAIAVDDASSNGNFNVLSKNFVSHATMNLAKIGGEWKVYSMVSNDNPFTLASWGDQGQGDYSSTQFGFKKIGEIKNGN